MQYTMVGQMFHRLELFLSQQVIINGGDCVSSDTQHIQECLRAVRPDHTSQLGNLIFYLYPLTQNLTPLLSCFLSAQRFALTNCNDLFILSVQVLLKTVCTQYIGALYGITNWLRIGLECHTVWLQSIIFLCKYYNSQGKLHFFPQSICQQTKTVCRQTLVKHFLHCFTECTQYR